MIATRYGRSLTRLSAAAAVAAAALALTGCGGGGGTATTTQDPPGGTMAPAQLAAAADTALKAAEAAVEMVKDDSPETVVDDADTKVAAAGAEVMKAPAAERAALSRRLGNLEGRLKVRKASRDAAMEKAAEMGMAEARKLRSGMVFQKATDNDGDRRDAYFSDFGGTLRKDATLNVVIGTEETSLKHVKDAVVEALGGGHHVTNEFYGGPWKGSKWTAAPDGKGTYTAMAWSGGRPGQGRSLSGTQGREYLADEGGWLRHPHLTEDLAKIDPGGFGFGVSPVQRYLPEGGAGHVEFRGIYDTYKGTYRCVPNLGMTCAARQGQGGQGSSNNIYGETWSTVKLGGTDRNNNFEANRATWTFKPDHPDRKKLNADRHAPYYGWWLHVSESGEMTASAFTASRGTGTSGERMLPARWRYFAHESRRSFGTAKYRGGAAGLYALGAESGEFIAKAAFDVDFGNAVDDMPGEVTGAVDGFMVRGLDSGKARASRDWKVELTRRDIGSGSNIDQAKYDLLDPAEDVVGGGKTRWLLDSGDPTSAAPLSGQWAGEFHEWDPYGNVPAHLTGTFLSERRDGRMVGAFGTDSPLAERPHYDD